MLTYLKFDALKRTSRQSQLLWEEVSPVFDKLLKSEIKNKKNTSEKFFFLIFGRLGSNQKRNKAYDVSAKCSLDFCGSQILGTAWSWIDGCLLSFILKKLSTSKCVDKLKGSDLRKTNFNCVAEEWLDKLELSSIQFCKKVRV